MKHELPDEVADALWADVVGDADVQAHLAQVRDACHQMVERTDVSHDALLEALCAPEPQVLEAVRASAKMEMEMEMAGASGVSPGRALRITVRRALGVAAVVGLMWLGALAFWPSPAERVVDAPAREPVQEPVATVTQAKGAVDAVAPIQPGQAAWKISTEDVALDFERVGHQALVAVAAEVSLDVVTFGRGDKTMIFLENLEGDYQLVSAEPLR